MYSRCSNFQHLTCNHVFLMVPLGPILSLSREKTKADLCRERSCDALVLLFPPYCGLTNMWYTRNREGDPQIGGKHIGNIKRK